MRILSPDVIRDKLKRYKTKLEYPQVYLGREPNTYHKDWKKAKLRILLAALWRYQDFRGNQTIPLLYQMINERYGDDVICERAHFPETEREYKLFRKYQIPIFSLESKRSAGEFDIIATSLSFLPPWINFPLMLEMSGIPPFWKDREQSYPMIMVGGSAMYGNFCIAYPVVDLIFLGDAEEGLFDLLSMWMNVKEHGLINQEGLEIAQKDFPFIFCPRFYTPKYNKEKFIGWKSSSSKLPSEFLTTKCKDFEHAPKYTKPIPSYTDTTMGLGEVEISRGCRGFCAFCGIGWKYRPYRERSKETMVKALSENRLEGGATALCPIATEFAYYSEKRALIKELCGISFFVDPLSMRVDAFASDREFDMKLASRGMNQLALGVEAVSQRLRNRFRKGVTKEDILEACKIAVAANFKRIKFFMISNIDEVWEDFEEFFDLLQEVNDIRARSHIKVKASWTPLFVEPCTPLQWKKPTIEQKQDWKQVDVRLRELKIDFALGIKNEENFLWMMQGMHLGDTRFAEAVAKATVKLKRPFYVAFSRKTKETVSEALKKTGGSWDYIMRERGADEVFPWDVVDRGVKKEALRRIYNKVISGQFDEVSATIKVQPEDCPLDPFPVCEEQAYSKSYVIRYKLIDPEYDVVPNTHFRAVVHRAAWKASVPIATNSLHFFSDRDLKNWYGGVDYFILGMKKELIFSDLVKMNNYLQGIQLEDFHSTEDLNGSWKDVVAGYEISSEISHDKWKEFLRHFRRKTKVEISQKETRYFSGIRKKRIDIVPLLLELATAREYSVVLYIKDDQVGVRPFLGGFLSGVSPRRILKFEINKIGLFERIPGGDWERFF